MCSACVSGDADGQKAKKNAAFFYKGGISRVEFLEARPGVEPG